MGGDSEHEEEHHQQSAFSQRFGAMTKFPSALKKVVSRERITSNEEETEYHHEKSSSFGTFFKNRFQPTFTKYINPTNNGTSSPSPGQYSSSNSHKHHRKKAKKKNKKQHRNSPTPPSLHSHSDSLNNLDSKAFEAIIGENRALKNEIEVYKRSIDALSSDKEHISQNYDNLKSKVTDITTQLRIMTRRYNKIKNKNEEYKKHFEHTLTVRLSAQSDTIRNYHHQLTQIKEKYDILYSEYLEKNNIIKEWEGKYHRLALDFDEFMNENSNNLNTKQPKPSILIQKCKNLKHSNLKKDESLNFLAQIISNLYHNSLPIIQNYAHRQNNGQHNDESSDSSQDSVSEIDGVPHSSKSQESQNRNLLNANLLIATPPNSSMDYEEDDDESMHPMIYHRSQPITEKKVKKRRKSKKGNNIKYRQDSHQNDDDNDDDDQKEQEEDLADSENQCNEQQDDINKYAKNNNLSIPVFDAKLKDRSLSGISVDDDGIDERDDDELEKQLTENPIKLPPKTTNKNNSFRSRPSFKQKYSDNNSVSIISTGKSSPPPPQTPTNSKKKRRRSWVMEGSNGPIIITTLDGKHSILETNDNKKKEKENKKTNGANSSSETVDIAPSPAPPPPHPNVLQTPNAPQRVASDVNNVQSQSDENRSSSPITSNIKSSPSPNPMLKNKKNKKNVKPDYSQNDNEDDEDLNVVIDDECESY